MAGGRWARQSYYDALSSLARNILEDAECYSALKLHLQRVRHHKESDPIPKPREEQKTEDEYAFVDSGPTKLSEAIHIAREKIEFADQIGRKILIQLITDEKTVKSSRKHAEATEAYFEAFAACARVRDMDKLAFHSHWFKEFYKRNYDALIIKSMYDNVIDDVDNVRYW